MTVIVRITSTVRAGSSQTDSATHTDDKSKQVGLGVGLGIGIPLVLVICTIPMWKYSRRRSRRTGLGAHMDGSSEDQGSNIHIPPPKAVMGIQRNSLDASIAGQSPKTMQPELDGVSLRYPEIDGRQQFELMGDCEPCEVEGRGARRIVLIDELSVCPEGGLV
ncbi:uncharacterized protein KD926_003736 [Aspergillus affinis]|uniref:uncharacterized protein n=1 Tax=Aspergillus affinis TaxID=1070780 RepID=UPI0022FE0597|nr:uncharacterized protein KD926_003736 [Aspergillus affinis]KAI9035318.1 hypothetical protein KD926_003736 [Aspergillus affinis]